MSLYFLSPLSLPLPQPPSPPSSIKIRSRGDKYLLVLVLAVSFGFRTEPCSCFLVAYHSSFSPAPRTALLLSRMPLSAATPNSDDVHGGWGPLNPESIVSAPCLIEQTLCEEPAPGAYGHSPPRLARDFDYASAVLEAWKRDESESGRLWEAETRRIVYPANGSDGGNDSDDDSPLYGHVVRKPRQSTSVTTAESSKVRGIILFHTAAGPHDLFLLWKAAALVNSADDEDGCVVLVADLLSDETGWGWDPDRSRYEAARENLMQQQQLSSSTSTPSISARRPVLRRRLEAAIGAISQVEGVDPGRIAALGWCLGGHAVVELARMNVEGLRAMATFHGVFDTAIPPSAPPSDDDEPKGTSEILVCHGTEDPFVSDESLEAALETFQNHRHRVTLLQLKGAKHGFSNPAQEFNPNPAFGYDAEAAAKSWHQSVALLNRRLR